MELKTIAHIHTDFPEKFGIPRQSGLVPTTGKIIFEPQYRNPDAVKGLDGYSHLWLIWGFSSNAQSGWTPTVRPPRLGGNRRMGVFATRSPFRPNSIGLSSVELERIEQDEKLGPVLIVKGADMVDNTPIFDIKPYLAYTDSHSEAVGGFSDSVLGCPLKAEISEKLAAKIPPEHRDNITAILENDPRPSYHSDPGRIYGMSYAGLTVRFRVNGSILTVCDVLEKQCNIHDIC